MEFTDVHVYTCIYIYIYIFIYIYTWLPTCGELLWLGGPRVAKKMKPPNPRPSPPPSKTVLDAEKNGV
jgi:hypothetical protein